MEYLGKITIALAFLTFSFSYPVREEATTPMQELASLFMAHARANAVRSPTTIADRISSSVRMAHAPNKNRRIVDIKERIAAGDFRDTEKYPYDYTPRIVYDNPKFWTKAGKHLRIGEVFEKDEKEEYYVHEALEWYSPEQPFYKGFLNEIMDKIERENNMTVAELEALEEAREYGELEEEYGDEELEKLTEEEFEEEKRLAYEEYDKLIEEMDLPNMTDSSPAIVIGYGPKNADAIVSVKGIEATLPRVECSLGGHQKAIDVLELGEEINVNFGYDWKGEYELERRSILKSDLNNKMIRYYQEGTNFPAYVYDATPFGVDCVFLGGVTQFMPKSQLAYNSQDEHEDLIGAELDVKIIGLEMEGAETSESGLLSPTISNRVALQDGSRFIMDKLERGTLVHGVVAGKQPYGIFVELESGPTGFIHVSQISNGMVNIDDVPLEVGMPVSAMVMSVDNVKGQIQLSTKVLESDKDQGVMMKEPYKVFENADKQVEVFRQRAEEQAKENERLAKAFLEQFGAGEDMFAAEGEGGETGGIPDSE